jgi:hypothetical protein
MKLLSYYLQITVPLAILFWGLKMNFTEFFFYGILFYAFIYRPFVDGIRLIKMGSMEKKEAWKLFIPFYYTTRYFHDLYFKR